MDMIDDKQQTPETEGIPTAEQQEAAPGNEVSTAAAEARITELEDENAKLKDQVLRALAETENVRRRLEQQAEDRGRYAVSGFAKDMLLVADNLRRALEAVPQQARDEDQPVHNLVVGVEMTERELLTALERHGVKPVPSLGSRFDPNIHQAMMEIDDASHPAGTVVMVMQGGYTIHDRLLRPAMVGVSKGGPKPSGNGESPQHVDTSV